MVSTIKRTKKLSLKPGQKLELLQKYILPRYIYNLLISPLSEGVLKLLESEIRHEVKGILHLLPLLYSFTRPKTMKGWGCRGSNI